MSKIYHMPFSDVYPLYIAKVEKKNRTKDELDELIFWLTGYNKESLLMQLDLKVDFECFFNEAPALNPNRKKITGKICGYDVQLIEQPLMQEIRFLDKIVDELAKGKSLEKIMRK